MFEALSDRLTGVFSSLSGKGRLSVEEIDAALREIRVALLEADVNFKVVKEFTEAIRIQAQTQELQESLTPGQQIVQMVHNQLVTMLGSEARNVRYSSEPPTIVMLVGLQGSGKTTTAAKLAVWIRKEGHKPALVALDPYRPAAIEQLETLAKNVDIPMVKPQGKESPVDVAKRALIEARNLAADVLVLDTAGRLQIDQPMLDELKAIRSAVSISDTFLVIDAMTGQEAVNVAKTFQAEVGIDAAIMTKLDGDARGGAALSLRASTGVPLAFCGVGEKIPDFELFHPERMAQRILGMGDILTLAEKAQSQMDQAQQMRMAERATSGQMTLDDWLEQMRAVRKLGPLDSIMGMIPGMGKMVRENAAAMPSEKQLSRMEGIVLSMTSEERSRPEIINGKRRQRIAVGSGNSVQEVNQMLKGFNQMQLLMKQLGGAGGMRKAAKLARQMPGLDPNLLSNHLRQEGK